MQNFCIVVEHFKFCLSVCLFVCWVYCVCISPGQPRVASIAVAAIVPVSGAVPVLTSWITADQGYCLQKPDDIFMIGRLLAGNDIRWRPCQPEIALYISQDFALSCDYRDLG